MTGRKFNIAHLVFEERQLAPWLTTAERRHSPEPRAVSLSSTRLGYSGLGVALLPLSGVSSRNFELYEIRQQKISHLSNDKECKPVQR